MPNILLTGEAAKLKRPKVKTGLMCTYRIRRVKCDETKPHCRRCTRFGVDCDGYPPVYRNPSSSRAILPKGQNPAIQSIELPKIRTLYSGPRFEDEQEGICFRHYCEETATQIAGPTQSPIWSKLIPQACETEPFLRHAVVAIAAVSKINEDAVSPGKSRTLDYGYALKQYSKSLRGMRLSLANRKHDMRNALLACILVYCFETLQGNLGTASTHARSGLLLISQWLEDNYHLQKPFYDVDEHLGKTPYNELDDWPEDIDCEMMASNPVDPPLRCTMSQLDLQILFFMDGRPQQIHHSGIPHFNARIKKMPARLLNLHDVRRWGNLLMRRNYRWILVALTASKSKELAEPWPDDSGLEWEDSAQYLPGENIMSTANLHTPELKAELLSHREDIRRFSRSVGLLFDQKRENGTHYEKLSVAIWEMNCLINHIMLYGVHFTDETDWDQFLPEFKKILALGQYCMPIIVAPLKGATRYIFNLGILIGLSVVSLRCRDRPTRHATLDLLRSVHYREGIFDSQAAALIGSWLAGIEEEGADEIGFIPGHKRVFLTRAVADIPNRRALLGCSQRSLSGLVYKKAVMKW
ncbi:hypothetical protein LSUE1_G006805 [Lachnellula suecica]|uniref:Zn(2)-C6 fungal-type domain-containing protein n=1 Tax=Lachnellula suecica TaxID=602035 RepID=A0A8T9C288_9HELO|nr:hypothetical protein LSUE1_G006805 [Lachnellula suecica]